MREPHDVERQLSESTFFFLILTFKNLIIMKKIVYLVTLVAISLMFVQCEQKETEKGSGKYKGHEYVDLGLPSGLKWATCNVGATTPEEYGDYFAWGEVEPKALYNWDTYKYQGATLLKYYYKDNKIILDPEDDAATMNWGGKWRMPTREEINELVKNCKFLYVSKTDADGFAVCGWKVKGPNGNLIYLPAAGNMIGDTLDYEGSYGDYWSSSLGSDYDDYAYSLALNPDDAHGYNDNLRMWGFSVRPVFK